jgi:Xaa-Pro aminopeptidase
MYQNIKELQDYLKINNAAAAFLCLPENLVLFSQYWPGYGASYIFIPAYGEPSIICPETELEVTKNCKLNNVIAYGDVRLEDGNPDATIISIIQRLLKEYGIKHSTKVAIELGEDILAPTYVANKVRTVGENTKGIISKGFGTDNFIPVKNVIRNIRSIKTDSDIEMLHRTNEILIKSLDYFETLLERPGIREIDVLAETECYFMKIASDYGAKAARAFGQLSTGLKTAIAYADCILSDNRVLEHGDLAMYEIGVCVDGYWADLTRTGCVGGLNGQKKEIYDIVKGSFDMGVKAARDGALAEDVDKACREFIEDAGYGKYFVHPTGHGVGFAHNERYPNLEPGSKEILHTNMVIAIEPGIYIPGMGGIRIEENVLVCKDGGKILGR